MGIKIRGARLVDPASGMDRSADLAIEAGKIVAIGRRDSAQISGEELDADGLVLTPGFVDLHVHFREPGFEESETYDTGARAAAAGGFTAVFPMANTLPVTDSVERVEDARRRASAVAWCDVHPVAALTRGLAGEEPTDIAALAAAGVRLFSDDGMPVGSPSMMRHQLHAAADAGVIVCNHAQDPDLTQDAQANEGWPAELAGLCGWPGVGESVMVARDVLLADDAGATLHVPHVSTAATVQLLRSFKSSGVRVTAEAAPHHFTLTDELVRSRDPVYKVNPPLRDVNDVAAIRNGLADGTIDVIATDHAPHAPDKKNGPWENAAFGMLGLETSLALTLTQLVSPGRLSLVRAIELLSTSPARIAGLRDHGGPIVTGAVANLVIFDPEERWTVNPRHFSSKSENSPYEGFELRGRVVHTLLRGAFTVREGKPVDGPI